MESKKKMIEFHFYNSKKFSSFFNHENGIFHLFFNIISSTLYRTESFSVMGIGNRLHSALHSVIVLDIFIAPMFWVRVYSIQYTVYSILYTVYSIQYTVYSIQYTVYSINHTYPLSLAALLFGQFSCRSCL